MQPGDTVYFLDETNLAGALSENRPELVVGEGKIYRIVGVEAVIFDHYAFKHLVNLVDVAKTPEAARRIAGRIIRQKAARMLAFAGLVETAA